MGLTLHDLPFELLAEIHLLSSSSSLPILNQHFRTLFSSLSPSYKAAYLLPLLPTTSPLFFALKYPIARSLPVFNLLEDKIRKRLLSSVSESDAKRLTMGKRPKRKEGESWSSWPRELPFPMEQHGDIWRPLLEMTNIPQSFVSSYDTEHFPLLLYIFDKYSVPKLGSISGTERLTLSGNVPYGNDGRLLSRACRRRDWVLVEMLCFYKGDATLKKGAALCAVIEGCYRHAGAAGEKEALEWVQRLSRHYVQDPKSHKLIGNLGLKDYRKEKVVKRAIRKMRDVPHSEVLEKARERNMPKLADWLDKQGASNWMMLYSRSMVER